MTQKKYSDDEALRLLLQIEDSTRAGLTLANACHKAGVTDSTYYNWKKRFRHLLPTIIEKNKDLKKENAQLKKTISDISNEMRSLQQFLRKITTNH